MKFPTLEIEKKFGKPIAGIDEAGRGPLAGPVVAAAVLIKNPQKVILPKNINDSKKLSPASRCAILSELKMNNGINIGIGISSVHEIDEINILKATMLAMKRAINDLTFKPELILVDGNQSPNFSCNSIAIPGGDRKCISISAASIVAKVTRDKIMEKLDLTYPHFFWESNKGYATKKHRTALMKLGPTPHHRKSFGLVKEILKKI